MLGKSLVILLIFGIVAVIELPSLIKERQWKELYVFSMFFLSALIITVMYQIFEFDFSPVSHWLTKVYSFE
ncbi:MAG TPA: hypothetical protein DCP90_08890 [Clostridiales bacterium]|nr:MAG: hypothetical protein A2Y22_03320 [Clostridiales bacterium GWD2_32_59]HAN10711.1 hypothetical protein [Clostridiales bacterium]